jgi:dCTP deaminase
MDTYECFNREGLNHQSGDMYLEVTPITFPVRVQPGTSLSQLRFFYGDPREAELRSGVLYRTIFHGEEKLDGSLTVDLQNTNIGGLQVAAFCAEPGGRVDAVPLWQVEPKPDPFRYWNLTESKDNRLKIEAERFYILRSKERISVPRGIAVYCRASDETIGEMRIHYAGFVHPWFGLKRTDGQRGTPLIFEVRGHQVNVSLADGERMANLTFYRMSEAATGEGSPTAYEGQRLMLSKFFGTWPERLKRSTDGRLQAA